MDFNKRICIVAPSLQLGGLENAVAVMANYFSEMGADVTLILIYNCINGKVEFIYVSVDREGKNKRNIYDPNWNPLHFTWAGKNKDISNLRGPEIPRPVNLDKMIEIAEQIAREFYYVRIDFYDVDGKVYFGEITQHHGGGFDRILPIDYDLFYGKLVKLPSK